MVSGQIETEVTGDGEAELFSLTERWERVCE